MTLTPAALSVGPVRVVSRCVSCVRQFDAVGNSTTEALDKPRSVHCPWCQRENFLLWPPEADVEISKRRERHWLPDMAGSVGLKGWVVFAVLFAVLRYRFSFEELSFRYSFSGELSFILAGIGVLLWLLLRDALIDGAFTPFRVHIRLKWAELLPACELINDEERWKRFNAEYENADKKTYNISRDGLNFTVLEPRLLFWNDVNRFQSDYSFRVEVKEIKFERSTLPQLPFSPAIVVKQAIDGSYVIGLTTPTIDNLPEFDPRSDMLPVATLPPEIFDSYFRAGQFVLLWRVRMARAWRKLENRLAAQGWSRWESELSRAVHLEHKYVSVSHEPV